MEANTNRVGFFQFHWTAVRHSFEKFTVVKDMIYGTLLAALTLGIQVWKHLIPLKDWKENWPWWLASFIGPYMLVLSAHIVYRLAIAPWRLYNKALADHAIQTKDREREVEQRIGKLETTHQIAIDAAYRDVEQLRSQLREAVNALGEVPAIIGSAELLIQRLNMDDLTAINDVSYEINLGVFLRTSVAVTDKPRTIRSFLLELHAGDTTYSAEAEREIGDYYHRYERRVHDERGYPIIQNMQEEMNNLLATVRTTPVAPNTQAEGWLRFELKNVKAGHEPQFGGKLRLYAFDVRNNRYEIDVANLQICPIDSNEYAVLRRR